MNGAAVQAVGWQAEFEWQVEKSKTILGKKKEIPCEEVGAMPYQILQGVEGSPEAQLQNTQAEGIQEMDEQLRGLGSKEKQLVAEAKEEDSSLEESEKAGTEVQLLIDSTTPWVSTAEDERPAREGESVAEKGEKAASEEMLLIDFLTPWVPEV
ncbi:Hypothetical predicted protein [Podarcis lilfordi]|uniref:Uncharacterized protein n=1 Tax=Podarcis lilfordi TaxID=74358 RepID=A0AA35L0B3_9SAUR|nr:Hypothetical predicted protein [Podarcis lilfordi]